MPKITYIEDNGKSHTVDVQKGLTVMEGAIQNNIPGIDADCGGSMACATCHVYVKEEWFDKVNEKSEGEDDMLDQAFEPNKFSRLSCQISVTDEIDGLTVNLPKKTMIKTDALIIGAGPTGLFTAHQLKLIGLDCEIVDNLDKIGGQCIELYPDKPIYDIPAIPECTGEELTNNLIAQLKPFNIKFHLNERVDEVKNKDGIWEVKTNKDTKFNTPNIIIAGGVGSFEPRKFPVKECEKFENKSVFYSIKDKTIFKNKTVSIFGGGDSALDWAIELSKDCKVNLIHRRDEFRAAQSTVDKAKELAKQGKINLLTKYQLKNITGSNNLESIEIEHEDKSVKNLKTDFALGFFGLIMQLGPIANWGLNLDKKTIPVDTEKFETNQKGIYAVGDICTYPGKLKLILSGFHEGALAARACFKLARPNEKYRFEFTTSSKTIKNRLGVKGD